MDEKEFELNDFVEGIVRCFKVCGKITAIYDDIIVCHYKHQQLTNYNGANFVCYKDSLEYVSGMWRFKR